MWQLHFCPFCCGNAYRLASQYNAPLRSDQTSHSHYVLIFEVGRKRSKTRTMCRLLEAGRTEMMESIKIIVVIQNMTH
jgi:hypothetical protein